MGTYPIILYHPADFEDGEMPVYVVLRKIFLLRVEIENGWMGSGVRSLPKPFSALKFLNLRADKGCTTKEKFGGPKFVICIMYCIYTSRSMQRQLRSCDCATMISIAKKLFHICNQRVMWMWNRMEWIKFILI